MLNLMYGTPVDELRLGTLAVRVKRDDLAGNDPLAPPLGKLRGLLTAIRASGGATRVGAVDRKPTSRNSWATAYLCKELGIACHAFFSELGPYQTKALELGADYTILPGLELEALYDAARRKFYGQYPYYRDFLPVDDCQATALVEDARQEVHRTDRRLLLELNTVVIPTGSGGLALGVMRGLIDLDLRPRIVLHFAGSRRRTEYLQGIVDGAGLRREFPEVRLINRTGDPNTAAPSFPCNPTYELPAWRWMVDTLKDETVLFWNAGG